MKKSLLEQALDLEENKNLYSATERAAIRNRLRQNLKQNLNKLNEALYGALDDLTKI
ncbi:hypothetical protein [Flagellimonas eckloniae]|uniref:hypothetical protein n=1 Tax=Flagellimonas eckloniae TaxID=346185 RepID=UPI0015845AA6|nr:hypothetical protein [Allomuricauda eckloniae]